MLEQTDDESPAQIFLSERRIVHPRRKKFPELSNRQRRRAHSRSSRRDEDLVAVLERFDVVVDDDSDVGLPSLETHAGT